MLKYLLSCLVIAVVSILAFNFLQVKAVGTVYYFNNAVDTNPATLGNYWLDYDATEPALSLPNLAIDELNVLPDATYTGDAIFRGNGVNEGTITGNATFYGDSTLQNYVVLGTKTRRYTSNITTFRDFTTFGEVWTVVADGCVVTMTSATYDTTTTFTTANGGSFFGGVVRYSTSVMHNTLVINYTSTLDSSSVPATSNFTVTVNGSSVPVTAVSFSGKKLLLTLSSSVSLGNTVVATYVRSGNLIKNTQGLNAVAFTNITVPIAVPVEDASVYSTLVGTKLYVSNNHSSSVTVIDTLTDTVLSTIPVGDYPEASVVVGNNLYVNNLQSDSVSVINTLTDTVIATIPVGDGPYFSTVVGTKIYVSNTGTNTVSVINTNTNTVTATITVGTNPWFSGVVGTKLYVPNRSTNTVSVIDTITDTVSSSIAVSAGSITGTRAVVVGTKVFVGRSNTMAVIDSTTDTVVATPSVGSSPYFSAVVGNKVYVPNRSGNTVSVINASTNTVTATITVGTQPYSITAIGDRVYVNNVTSNSVSVINTLTDTVVNTLTMGGDPFYSTAVGSKLYVSNNIGRSASVVDTTLVTSLLPNLTSFSSSTSDGEYSTGDAINITANFGQSLAGGSTMTVALNSGASVVLNSVSGTTLSGTYTIGAGEVTPDLSVSSITSASVTDTSARNRTSYSLPASQGSLVAENSFITRNLGDTKNIVIGSYQAIEVGEKPYQMTAPITVGGIPYLYVANQGDDSVSVIRKTDHTTTATISVGSEPYGLSTISISGTTYVYVANTGSNTVSVINTNSNSVVATVTVGVKPYYVAMLGTKAYVTNSLSNTVSVIDTATNTVSTTIPVGVYPRGIRAYSTYLYVSNYGDPNYSGGNSISVIDSATNTVSATIVLPAGSTGPRGITSLGTNVYVANFRSNNVSVINTATNAVTDTITVGTGPRGIVGLGTKIYVENFDAGTISVIDTNTNTVTNTITVGHSPSGMAISGTDIYVSRFQDNFVSILNTTTNTLRAAFPIISNIRSYVALPTKVDISWTTDIESDSTVEYGLTSDYGSILTSASLSPSHSLSITNLPIATTFHYRVTSVDATGNSTMSGDYTFTTTSGGVGIGGGSKPRVEPIGPDSPTGNSDSTDDNSEQPNSTVDSSNPLSRLGSKILLAVENRGELWYEHSRDGKRYHVTPATALELFKTVALGITNNNINKIPEVTSNKSPGPLAQRLKNLFLLQVENKGQTWYVDQLGFRHFVTRFNIIDMSRNVMTGILNKELDKIEVGQTKK